MTMAKNRTDYFDDDFDDDLAYNAGSEAEDSGFSDEQGKEKKPMSKGKKRFFLCLAAVLLVVLVIVGIRMFAEPKIKNIKNMSALDHSLLVKWQCSEPVDHYRVAYRPNTSAEWFTVISYDIICPLRNLPDCTSVDVEIYPVSKGIEYEPGSITIALPEPAAITSVVFTVNRRSADGTVQHITAPTPIDAATDTIDLSWEYSGKECGFNVYLDPQTPGKTEILPFVSEYIEPGAERVCHIDGLCAGTKYLLSIVPDADLPSWYERTIYTADFAEYAGEFGFGAHGAFIVGTDTVGSDIGDGSISATNLEAVSAKWSAMVISEIPAEGSFVIGALIDGKATGQYRNCAFEAFFYDSDGKLAFSGRQQVDVNSVGSVSARVIARPFAAPAESGKYTVTVTMNGRIIASCPLTVTKAG